MMHRHCAMRASGVIVAALLGLLCQPAPGAAPGGGDRGVLIPPLVALRPLVETPAANLAPQRALGNAVAMDLDTALVGAPGGGTGQGMAYVFTRALTGEWQQQAQLEGSGGSDEFGASVALAGETALVGTGGKDDPAAYVFVRNGDSWSLEARLPVSRGTMNVALSPAGDRAVVGVSGGADPRVEAVHVLARSADGTWVQEDVLAAPPGTAAGSGFGWSVAIAGEQIVVGAPQENGGGGAVHVFQRDSAGHWQRQARLTLQTASPPALFGWSVAFSGRTLMVGAFGEDSFRGAAYLFQEGPEGTWSRQARLTPDDRDAPRQCFGFSVALTLYGALIGQPCAGEGGGQATRVYLFSKAAAVQPGSLGSWARRTVLSSPLADSVASFGTALATNGLDVVIGSPGEEEGGAAYVLECLPCLLYGG